MEWYTVLNNREWATLIWLSALVIWASTDKKIRASFVAVIKAFLATPILVSFVLLAGYITALVFGLKSIGLWGYLELKDTIIWSVFVAAATLFDILNISKDEKYFRKAILDNLKASLFVEFLVNLYVFNFLIELVLVPTVLFLGILLGISQTDQKYDKVKGCLNWLLSLIGIGILGYALYNAYNDIANLATIETAKNFASPIVLSILFLPFIYAAMVYFKYESFYNRLQIFIKDPQLLKYTKLQATLFCKLDLKRLDRFAKKIIFQRPTNKQEVLKLLKDSKSSKSIPSNETLGETDVS